MLIERIGCASCKASISAIFMLFIENIHLLLENISIFTKTITIKENKVLVKTRLF